MNSLLYMPGMGLRLAFTTISFMIGMDQLDVI
jgi:hypothetical protein